jgi:hypothetical protein
MAPPAAAAARYGSACAGAARRAPARAAAPALAPRRCSRQHRATGRRAAGRWGTAPAEPAGTGAGAGRRRPRERSPSSRPHWITRTALCVEVRDPQRANGPKAEREHGGKSGVLYVFMPPLERLEDYLDLLAAVEATARSNWA